MTATVGLTATAARSCRPLGVQQITCYCRHQTTCTFYTPVGVPPAYTRPLSPPREPRGADGWSAPNAADLLRIGCCDAAARSTDVTLLFLLNALCVVCRVPARDDGDSSIGVDCIVRSPLVAVVRRAVISIWTRRHQTHPRPLLAKLKRPHGSRAVWPAAHRKYCRITGFRNT